MRLSANDGSLNQGATIAIEPNTGIVSVAWRRFTRAGSTDDRRDHGGAVGESRRPIPERHRGPPAAAAQWALSHHRADPGAPPGSTAASEIEELSEFDQGTSAAASVVPHQRLSRDDVGRSRPPVPRMDRTRLLDGARTSQRRRWRCEDRDGQRRLPASSGASPRVVAERDTLGHQFMPSLTFAGGKLMLVYYDLREDVTGFSSKFIDDKTAARLDRQAAHDGYSRLDGDTGVRARVRSVRSRVRLLHRPQAGRAASIAEARAVRAESRWRRANSCSSTRRTCRCSSWHGAVHRRLHRHLARAGVRADRQGSMGVQHGRGMRCRCSTPCGATTATCARRPAATGRKYTPPDYGAPGARASVYDPTKQVTACDGTNADTTGSRNQNIYTARIAGGLLVGSPGNTKPLSATLQRGFVVFAQNMTTATRSFRMRILNQPLGGRASFAQFPLPPLRAHRRAPLTSLDVTTPRTSYVTSRTVIRHVDRSASRRSTSRSWNWARRAAPDGLSGTIIINADIENPLIGADIENADIENADIENPRATPTPTSRIRIGPDRAISRMPTSRTRTSRTPTSRSDIENADIENADIENADIENATSRTRR